MKQVFFFLCLTILSPLLYAQSISAIVQDDKGLALRNVEVVVLESNKSTFSDAEGKFNLPLDNGTFSLRLSLFGYQNLTKSLSLPSDSSLVFILKPLAIEIDLVEIQSKKLNGKAIMEKVSAQRENNLKKSQNYSLSSYLKFSLIQHSARELDSIPPILIQRQSKVFSRNNRFKEIVLSEKQWMETPPESKFTNNHRPPSENTNRFWQKTNPTIYGINWEDNQFNLYQSWIALPGISEAPFVSPCSNIANLYYEFEISKTYLNNKNNLCYRINVIPRSVNQQTFQGWIEVENSSWQILQSNLNIQESKHFYYLEFSQNYSPYLNSDTLLISNLSLKYLLKKGDKVMEGKVEQQMDNYDLSEPDSKIFGNELRSFQIENTQMEVNAKAINFNYTPQEQLFIQKVDSLNSFWESEAYQKQLDSISNKITLGDIFLRGIDRYNHQKGYKFIIDPLLEQMRFFGVGGYRHSLGGKALKNFSKGHEIKFGAQADYGFNNQDLRGSLELSYTYLPKKFAYFKIGGGSKYQMLTTIQNIASLFSRNNFVLNDYLELAHGIELMNGLYLDINAKFMDRSSIKNLELSDWENDLFGNNNNIPLDFEDYRELNVKFKVDYTPFQKFEKKQNRKIILGSKWPTFLVLLEQGVPNFTQSNIHYQKLELGLNQTIKWKVFGTGKYGIKAGKFLYIHKAYYPNYQFYRGTDNYLFANPINSFQLLGPTLITSDNYMDAHYVHHFNDLLTKRIPIINKLKLESVAGVSVLLLKQNNFKHTEVFVGLEKPFKISSNKFKLGVYYVAATSTVSPIGHQIKIGLNYYNNFSREWIY